MKNKNLIRKIKGPGGRIRTYYHGSKKLGTILEGPEKRVCTWNYNSFYGEYMTSFDAEAIVVQYDNGWKNQEGKNIENVPVDRCVFLSRIKIEEPRHRPDFDKMLIHFEEDDLYALQSAIDAKIKAYTRPRHEKMMKDMEEAFNNPENIARWTKEAEEERALKDHQYKRIQSYINNLNEASIESTFKKFLDWETKYEEMWYDRHVQTHSKIFGVLMEVLAERGEVIDDGFKCNGYKFELFIGQGSFWRISKGRKIIFQNV